MTHPLAAVVRLISGLAALISVAVSHAAPQSPALSKTPEVSIILVYLHLNGEKTRGLDAETLASARKSHFANIGRMSDAGQLRLAGPTGTGDGIFVLSTSSLADAQSWLSSDGAIASGLLKPELIPGSIHSGRVCKASAPVKLVKHTLIAIRSKSREIGDRFTAAGAKLVIRSQDDRTFAILDAAVTAPILGEKNGSDAITSPVLLPEGSFCEASSAGKP